MFLLLFDLFFRHYRRSKNNRRLNTKNEFSVFEKLTFIDLKEIFDLYC